MNSKRKKGLTVGFIGLGFMGSAISANILKGGFTVWGYDVDPARTDILLQAGGRAASNSREVAQRADVLITSLASPEAFQDVVWAEEGILSAKHRGLIVLECSTLEIADKEKALEAAQRVGTVLLDCPISGGTRAAQKDLVVYGSGDQGAYASCVPIVETFARANYYVGRFGNGSRMKLIANLLVAIHNVSTAEAMVLGMRAGLDAEMLYKVMCDSSGRSRMFEVRAPRMVKNDYDHASMKVRIFQKDLEIIAKFAQSLKCPTPLFTNCTQIYLAAMAKGLAEQDTASVCAVLEDLAQLSRDDG